MTADRCECEHADHFGTEPDTPTGHTYGANEPAVADVKTTFGTFSLCRPCLDAGHMQGPHA